MTYTMIMLEMAAETAKKAPNFKVILIASLVIALIVGLLRMLSLKGQLTSVHKSESAADYTRDNSFKVDTSRDLFLYSKTEKKEKPNSSEAK
ncbi:MAG: hypothetical protein IKX87_12975 [Lachnospiraceae bacterium]|nr:hypothetical protein [Lachnospiraceae bacterium]